VRASIYFGAPLGRSHRRRNGVLRECRDGRRKPGMAARLHNSNLTDGSRNLRWVGEPLADSRMASPPRALEHDFRFA